MKLLMRHKLKVLLAFLVLGLGGAGLLIGTPPVASQTGQPSAWSKRCNESDPSLCEIFWRSNVPQTGQRIAEFAIGFPKGSETARGVMILPLGILLTEEVQMQIDTGLAFKFKVKYCDTNGCVANLNVSGQVLDALRKGTTATVMLKTAQEQDVRIEIPLTGFKKTLEAIS